MEKKKIEISYSISKDIKEFADPVQELIKKTISNADNAYAPYSSFQVSAGIILGSGTQIFGNNVENASYPIGICAERTALALAISNYPSEIIKTISVYVDKDLPHPAPPCGMCRQSILEAEKRQNSTIEIVLINKNGTYYHFESGQDLLPLAFDGDLL